MCFSKTGLKIFLLVINVVFFLCGGIILGIGVWAVADKLYIADILGAGTFRSAAYLMVISGVILILISFLGCLGAISGKRMLLLIYLILLVVVFVLLLATAIVAVVFQDDIEANMQQKMERSIRDQYGIDVQYNEDNEIVTEAWDKAQSSLECCGVVDEGWFVYRSSRWFQSVNGANQYAGVLYNPNHYQQGMKFVPLSCCVYSSSLGSYLNTVNCQSYKYGPPNHNELTAARNDALHYLGCYDAARRFIVNQSTMMLALGFSFCVFLISGIVISAMFLRKLGSSSEGRADLRYR